MVVNVGVTVDAVTDRTSENVAGGSELFISTSVGDTRIVSTSIAVADQDTLVEGQDVTYFPNITFRGPNALHVAWD